MGSGVEQIRRAGLRLEVISDHEGRCLVADHDFSAGSVILVEKPIVRDNVAALASAMVQRRKDFDLLRGAQNLAAAEVREEDAVKPFMLEAETNSFIFQGKVVAFNIFSMLNHACSASVEENVCFTILSTGEAISDEVKLVAIRDIQAGEALRISYHELYADPTARQERIRAHCGGFCACSRCQLEREDISLAATIPLCVQSQRAKCQVCSAEKCPEQGDVVEFYNSCLRELKGSTGILREFRSDGILIELLHQGQRECRTVPPDAVRAFDGRKEELSKCGACKSVCFCSRSCQREGWKQHKEFCSAGSWKSDRAKLESIRKKYEVPQNRQLASESELATAFDSFQLFIEKWTQVGRIGRLGSGHQAVQEAILFAIPIGTLLLWKVASRKPAALGGIYSRLLKLVHMNLLNVRLLVPRFHIAHWTALYYVNGILMAKELVQLDLHDSSHGRLVKALSADFERCLDIAEVFDPNVAKSFRYGQSECNTADGQSSQLFQQISRDPSKLAAFYNIDPELPLEQKMEQMSRLLSESGQTSATSGRKNNQPNSKAMTSHFKPAGPTLQSAEDTRESESVQQIADVPDNIQKEYKPVDLNMLD